MLKVLIGSYYESVFNNCFMSVTSYILLSIVCCHYSHCVICMLSLVLEIACSFRLLFRWIYNLGFLWHHIEFEYDKLLNIFGSSFGKDRKTR